MIASGNIQITMSRQIDDQTPPRRDAHPRMLPVIRLRVAAIQLAHTEGVSELRRLIEEKIVILHRAIGMAEPSQARITHERFCCNRRSTDMTDIRPAGSRRGDFAANWRAMTLEFQEKNPDSLIQLRLRELINHNGTLHISKHDNAGISSPIIGQIP